LPLLQADQFLHGAVSEDDPCPQLKSGQQLPEVSATRREFPAMSFRTQLADGRSLTHARQRTSPQEIWLRTWASKSVPPICAYLKQIFGGSVKNRSG
jgi:hypothetical protein